MISSSESQLKASGNRRRKALDDFIEEHNCATFQEFEQILSYIRSSSGRSLIFRGHSDRSWSLTSTLERFIGRSALPEKRADLLAECEEVLLADFKRGAHLYSRDRIADDDRLGWLSLMQHHGTPTRLLDWTESPYIALYFAVEASHAHAACLCAVDLQMLEFGNFELWRRLDSGGVKTAFDYLGTLRTTETPEERARSFNDLAPGAAHTSMPGIAAVRPFKVHRRLTAQQGLFLVPYSSMKSFSDSLREILSIRVRGVGPLGQLIYRIGLTGCSRSDLLRQLWDMNINHATLFPGLDGFAHSLGTRLELEGVDHRL